MSEKTHNGAVFLRHIEDIRRLINEQNSLTSHPLVIAIDGRSCSGKSTLAELLLECGIVGALVHTDDFYLPLSLRTPDAMKCYHGHMDLARLEREVLLPHSQGLEVSYRPFFCKRQAFLESVAIPKGAPIALEGSYSLHPLLRPYSHIRILLDTDRQRERLLAREGEDGLERFLRLWVPREEEYLAKTNPEKIADLIIKT